ncbi:U6 snRNA-associated Sm-like protein LSm1 [Oppia nitens]|uniref:U6 snRNA-associated Sm-like protein LSm1 n=1 Tax=Oppia nitens TaxID=1686743 RepID=UPI0023DB6F2B|nr:U6 snRNA-associated Sm-like protein LSm1 [Oppia nitens]
MNNFPGNTSLLEELDKKLMVLLRDGRTLIGYLRSIDQFANLVLHQTIERIYVDNKYGDIPRGIFLIRGENMVLCGEIDTKKETPDLVKVAVEEILELQQNQIEEKQNKDKIRLKALHERGLSSHVESIADDF